MDICCGILVPVRGAWNAWQSAEVHLEDLHNVHWHQPPGAPRPLVHAYVECTKIGGQIVHDCAATPPPHRLLVCVLKRQASATAYQELVRRAAAVGPSGDPPSADAPYFAAGASTATS